jgi:hypothetical protein
MEGQFGEFYGAGLLYTSYKQFQSGAFDDYVYDETQKNNERWNALVIYDDDIRAAVEKLRPYGERWVSRLGRDFFSLNEDKGRLPTIVDHLLQEAEREKWKVRFRQTADGHPCTDDALNILRSAEAEGYTLGIEQNGTFTASKAGTIYMRSNSDIQRLGRYLGPSDRRPQIKD